jgi:hypothetical protein
MNKYMKSSKGGWVTYVLAFFFLFVVWLGCDRIKASMNDLSIQEMPKASSNLSVTDVKSLPWVWEKGPAVIKQERQLALEKQEQQLAAGKQLSEADVDAVFGKKPIEEPKPVQPKFEFDKFFTQNAHLSAVASNGAVINGRFYEVGTDMEMLAMMGERGNKVVPSLQSVNDAGITVRIGKQSVRMLLNGGASL